MIRTFALFAGLAGSIMLADPASACVPLLPEPRLEGESDLAYQTRVEKMKREWDEQRAVRRQQNALNAPTLFIARAASATVYRQEAEKWSAEQAKLRKPGEPPAPPIPPPPPQVPGPLYFQPITWIKGTGSPAMLRIEAHVTMCDSWWLGDTSSAKEGEDLLFSAREGPISENTLIDAIAIDKITEPELVELVAKHREHGAGSESPEPPRP
jgi:hypothetical protein